MPHSFQPPLHSGRVVNYYSPLLRCHRSLSLSPVGSATSSHKVSPTSRGRSPHRGTAPPLSSRPSATNRPLASLALRRRNVSHLFVFLFFSTCHSQLLPMRCTGKKEISDIWGKRGASYGETGVCRRIIKRIVRFCRSSRISRGRSPSPTLAQPTASSGLCGSLAHARCVWLFYLAHKHIRTHTHTLTHTHAHTHTHARGRVRTRTRTYTHTHTHARTHTHTHTHIYIPNELISC